MLVAALLNPKGGVGRTTATLLLAMALSERGWRVAVADLDPTASAYALAAGGRGGYTCHGPRRVETVAGVIGVYHPACFRRGVVTLEQLSWDSRHDVLLVDVPPGFGRGLREALAAASLVVPIAPMGQRSAIPPLAAALAALARGPVARRRAAAGRRMPTVTGVLPTMVKGKHLDGSGRVARGPFVPLLRRAAARMLRELEAAALRGPRGYADPHSLSHMASEPVLTDTPIYSWQGYSEFTLDALEEGYSAPRQREALARLAGRLEVVAGLGER